METGEIKTKPLEKQEKFLLLWEKNNRRSEHLSNIITTIDGVALTAFLAIFTISYLEKITPVIGIFILFIWRWYAHTIDEEIINLYERMIICENELVINDDKLSLKKILNNQLNAKGYKKYLNRNHGFFDFFAIILMIILTWYSYPLFNCPFFSVIVVIGILGAGIVFVMLNNNAFVEIKKIIERN